MELNTEYNQSWALLIGINEYSSLPSLEGAVHDTLSVASVLEQRFAFEKQRSFVLLDAKATSRSVTDHLEQLAQQTNPDDRVLIYFAGHGVTRKTPSGQNIGYVATVDTIAERWNTYLKYADITQYADLMRAKHILFVFDSCFSGLALNRSSNTAMSETNVAKWLKDSLTRKARQVLTSGLNDEVVPDYVYDGHSLFTYYLLRALTGEAAGSEGEILATEVMAYVANAVMKDSKTQQKPAYGDIQGSEVGGDFVFQFPTHIVVNVPANKEGGINTGLKLQKGDQVTLHTSGIISYDSGNHFTNADGVLCSSQGQPLAHPQALKTMIWPHSDAYRTKTGDGIIGALIGWVDVYDENTAFHVGSDATFVIENDGVLHLAVNDAKGTYGDNQGEYQVSIHIGSK